MFYLKLSLHRNSISFRITTTDTRSKMNQTEAELDAVKSRQQILDNQVDTIDKELTSVKSQQSILIDRVNRDLIITRNQSDAGNIQITAEGIFFHGCLLYDLI